jgi:hypothetical protein
MSTRTCLNPPRVASAKCRDGIHGHECQGAAACWGSEVTVDVSARCHGWQPANRTLPCVLAGACLVGAARPRVTSRKSMTCTALGSGCVELRGHTSPSLRVARAGGREPPRRRLQYRPALKCELCGIPRPNEHPMNTVASARLSVFDEFGLTFRVRGVIHSHREPGISTARRPAPSARPCQARVCHIGRRHGSFARFFRLPQPTARRAALVAGARGPRGSGRRQPVRATAERNLRRQLAPRGLRCTGRYRRIRHRRSRR